MTKLFTTSGSVWKEFDPLIRKQAPNIVTSEAWCAHTMQMQMRLWWNVYINILDRLQEEMEW